MSAAAADLEARRTARLAAALAQRALPDGSACGRPGEPTRVDATAWAAVAWRLLGDGERAVRAGWALAGLQGGDGRVSSSPLHPGASWPTPVAVLAWGGTRLFDEQRRRALGYLLAVAGQTQARDPTSPSEVDPSIAGWPWVERTFSWVGPTALALLALEANGEGEQARAREGRRLLLDRQLASGGWNYGNTVVYGNELLPAPEETAPALAALAGHVERAAVARSLDLLVENVGRVRTPLTLGWGLLALSAWGLRPADADVRLEQSFELAERYGGGDTAELALLVIAGLAQRGLIVALRNELAR